MTEHLLEAVFMRLMTHTAVEVFAFSVTLRNLENEFLVKSIAKLSNLQN